MKTQLEKRNIEDVTNYLEAIIQNAIDAIITIDEFGKIETVNKAAVNFFGYNIEELIGKNISMLMPEPHRKNHDQYIEAYKKTGHRKILGIGREVDAVTKSRGNVPIRLAVSEATIGGKRIFIGTMHDLSDVKTAEAEIKDLNEKLEQKVNQRTEELADAVNQLLDANNTLHREIQERKDIEAALRKSEKELKKALDKEKELSQLKSRFVTMASHEFRTPLSAIFSSAEIIEMYTINNPEDKRMKHISRIKASVTNLNNILNDFITMSKMEEDKFLVSPVKLKPADFLHEVTEEIKGMLKTGQYIDISGNFADAEIVTDKSILRNILLNLISNAIKYSSPGKPIHCICNIENNKLEIVIKDQGIGIPEDEQQHLFTRFFRAKNAENIQGTGLGLNIVRRYLDALDGDISFESRLGEGSSFKIGIPLVFTNSYQSTS